ncbi:MAG TPA: AraC family transcriptional regulator [Frateuria sp.]|uniref:AraC family transcriptional regulator n=1 Tax=Frateuria sp. TaxID=2211372 RepID=UPI002DF0FEE3|nr:AraC family transcriptional regulator [Frateuria sp.]
MRAPLARTSFAVLPTAARPVETIAGECRSWRFRPHFHAGDEVVDIHAGRARLRLPQSQLEVAAGDTVVVPAGTVHRFEPIDGSGWAFTSRFVPPATCKTPTERPFGARVKAMLIERATLHTDMEALARACAVSVGHLGRIFRRETGTGLHNFHVLLALHRAKALLRDQAGIAEAALDAGFYDQAHLNREFVRTFGMTPAAFRAGWSVAA